MVLEILEDVDIDAELVAGVRTLVDQGYTLALDDVTFDDKLIPLLGLTQIVKVELPKAPRREWGAQLERFRRHKVKVLAEKIETRADFKLCRELGFDLFQGYFLSKPQLISGKQPTSNQIAVLQLMSELSQPDVTIDDLEQTLRRDESLSFKLLRYINSAKCGLRRRVDSLRQGIVLLGIQGVRTLTMLVALSNLSCIRPETLKLAMVRALVCEKLGAQVRGGDVSACFTAGLVSMLEAVVGMPMAQLLSLLPISAAVHLAVTEHQGLTGAIVRCAISLERCDEPFSPCDELTAEQIRIAYLQAVAETN